jgi:hypothetical protein
MEGWRSLRQDEYLDVNIPAVGPQLSEALTLCLIFTYGSRPPSEGWILGLIKACRQCRSLHRWERVIIVSEVVACDFLEESCSIFLASKDNWRKSIFSQSADVKTETIAHYFGTLQIPQASCSIGDITFTITDFEKYSAWLLSNFAEIYASTT